MKGFSLKAFLAGAYGSFRLKRLTPGESVKAWAERNVAPCLPAGPPDPKPAFSVTLDTRELDRQLKIAREQIYTLRRPNVFAGTTTKWDFADVLTAHQKDKLLFMERHGEKEHLHQAGHAIESYKQTGDVEKLRGAIAILIHLLETQH